MINHQIANRISALYIARVSKVSAAKIARQIQPHQRCSTIYIANQGDTASMTEQNPSTRLAPDQFSKFGE
jgi:hypothetical protein